jgi:hypothetical protein
MDQSATPTALVSIAGRRRHQRLLALHAQQQQQQQQQQPDEDEKQAAADADADAAAGTADSTAAASKAGSSKKKNAKAGSSATAGVGGSSALEYVYSEDVLVTANDEYKLKVWDVTLGADKTCRRTVLAPTYGGPINRYSPFTCVLCCALCAVRCVLCADVVCFVCGRGAGYLCCRSATRGRVSCCTAGIWCTARSRRSWASSNCRSTATPTKPWRSSPTPARSDSLRCVQCAVLLLCCVLDAAELTAVCGLWFAFADRVFVRVTRRSLPAHVRRARQSGQSLGRVDARAGGQHCAGRSGH